MFRDELQTLPDRLVSQVDPGRVQEYLRANGWIMQPRSGGKVAAYARPEADEEQVLLPLSHELQDFTPRMAEAIAYIAQWERRPARDVLNSLLLPPADVLRFSESGPSASGGTLPLDHGLDLLGGVRKALLAAACSVTRPERFHPRMTLGDADLFLQQCRLGQTERGSYTVTVACPMDAVPGAVTLFDPTPFARRATSLLMRSVRFLAQALERGEPDAVLTPAQGDPVVSANLCEGLLDMTPQGEGSSLMVSANWSKTVSVPEDGGLPDKVRLPGEVFGRVETLADRLRPAPPPRRLTFVGFVDTLDGRPNVEGRREGPVFLRTVEPEGGSIRARVELNAADHHAAWEAYDRDQPVVLQGVLRRTGRTYRIDEAAGFHALTETTNPSSAEGT